MHGLICLQSFLFRTCPSSLVTDQMIPRSMEVSYTDTLRFCDGHNSVVGLRLLRMTKIFVVLLYPEDTLDAQVRGDMRDIHGTELIRHRRRHGGHHGNSGRHVGLTISWLAANFVLGSAGTRWTEYRWLESRRPQGHSTYLLAGPSFQHLTVFTGL